MFDRMGPVQTDAASSVAQLVPGPLGPASEHAGGGGVWPSPLPLHRPAACRSPSRQRRLLRVCCVCVCLSFWDEVCFSSSDRLARQTRLPFLFCFVCVCFFF